MGNQSSVASVRDENSVENARLQRSLLSTPVSFGSVREFAAMLLCVVNDGNLPLSTVRRMAMVVSIERVSSSCNHSYPPGGNTLPHHHHHESQEEEGEEDKAYQALTEIIAEGILGSPTLSDAKKDLIVREGLIEQRWHRVISFRVGSGLCGVGTSTTTVNDNSDLKKKANDNSNNNNNNKPRFLKFRKMIVCLLRTSRRLQHLPESSMTRLEAMIFQTTNETELHDLMFRVLERTCGSEIKTRIMDDFTSNRFYRLLLPDRLDCCEEEENMSIMATIKKKAFSNNGAGDNDNSSSSSSKFCFLDGSSYKRILLLEEHEAAGACPICLDPVHAPAVQLQCNHIFCGRCIGDWTSIQTKNTNIQSTTGNGRNNYCANDKTTGRRDCPVCRRPLG